MVGGLAEGGRGEAGRGGAESLFMPAEGGCGMFVTLVIIVLFSLCFQYNQTESSLGDQF